MDKGLIKSMGLLYSTNIRIDSTSEPNSLFKGSFKKMSAVYMYYTNKNMYYADKNFKGYHDRCMSFFVLVDKCGTHYCKCYIYCCTPRIKRVCVHMTECPTYSYFYI